MYPPPESVPGRTNKAVLEQFFHSEYYGLLTKVDPEYLMRKIKEKADSMVLIYTVTGLIDEGYSGEITVKLYNHSGRDYEVKAGDKISQLVIIPVKYEPVEIVDEIGGGERGDAGFGSTGRT